MTSRDISEFPLKKTDGVGAQIVPQVWNDEILPEGFVTNVQSIARDNPHPERNYYYFLIKESVLKLIKDKYPFLYDKAVSE